MRAVLGAYGERTTGLARRLLRGRAAAGRRELCGRQGDDCIAAPILAVKKGRQGEFRALRALGRQGAVPCPGGSRTRWPMRRSKIAVLELDGDLYESTIKRWTAILAAVTGRLHHHRRLSRDRGCRLYHGLRHTKHGDHRGVVEIDSFQITLANSDDARTLSVRAAPARRARPNGPSREGLLRRLRTAMKFVLASYGTRGDIRPSWWRELLQSDVCLASSRPDSVRFRPPVFRRLRSGSTPHLARRPIATSGR